MDGGHAEFLGDREVRRDVVGENALARLDPEFVSGDQVVGGVRLARSCVARDDHGVENAVQVVARVRVVLAVAPRIRQQADSDASFAGALDQAQDLGRGRKPPSARASRPRSSTPRRRPIVSSNSRWEILAASTSSKAFLPSAS